MSGRFRSLSLAAASASLCLLGSEAVLRLGGAAKFGLPVATTRNLMIQPSEVKGLPYELRPNSPGESMMTEVETNSNGLRDKDYPREKGERYRVLVLGDSIAFGTGVRAEETFEKLLEKRLQGSGGPPVDVINSGVPGYNTLDEAVFLSARGLQYRPDLVVLAYCVNDTGIMSGQLNEMRSRWATAAPFRYSFAARLLLQELKRVSSRISRLPFRLEGYSASEIDLLQMYPGQTVDTALSADPELQSLRNRLIGTPAAGDEVGTDFGITPWYESPVHLGRLEFGLGEISRMASRNRFRVLAALFPFLDSRHQRERWKIVSEIIGREMRKFGFAVLDLAPALMGAGVENVKLRAEDPIHLNRLGNRIVAEQLNVEIARYR